MTLRLLCVLFSIGSGLLGFVWAVEIHPEQTPAYVQAGTCILLVQVLLVAIASRKKNRLANPARLNAVHLRSELAATIGGVVFLPASAIALFSPASSDTHLLFAYFALGMLAVTLQLKSFGSSAWMQVHFLSRFWRIQLIGAISRLLAVFFLVKLYHLSFLGILFANVLAASTIALCYRCLLVRIRKIRWHLRLLMNFAPTLVTLDGCLRAARLNYESLLLSFTLISADILKLQGLETLQYMYASTGYLNTCVTALRQLFAPYELQAFQRRLRSFQATAIWLGFLAGALAILNAGEWTHLHYLLLPSLPSSGQSLILDSVTLAVAFYPLTLGFAFLDYMPGESLRRVATALLVLPLPVFLLAWGFSILFPIVGFPFWAAVTPLSIALSKYYW